MYWYLSFLRPPPVSVSQAAGGVQITPQVANDLRTELRYDPTEIGYQWQRVASHRPEPSPLEHLTTFEPPQSTYKPISVPLPTSARIGESWRLGLAAISASGPSRPRLGSYCRADPAIVPVWSEPISITGQPSSAGPIRGARGKRKDGASSEGVGVKQTRVQREWHFGTGPNDGRLTIVEQTSFDLDKKIWDSGIALSAWLWTKLVDEASSTQGVLVTAILSVLKSPTTLHVLEIGGGTGLVSIVLRRALSRMPSGPGIRVTSTDLPSAIPLMEENINLNSVNDLDSEDSRDVDIEARILDWDEPLPPWLDVGERGEPSWPNLVVAADVTYNTASFPSLVCTITSLLDPKNSRLDAAPTLLLAYKQRDPAERDLWDMLRAKGVEMVLVDRIQGAEEEGAVEIWMGKPVPKA